MDTNSQSRTASAINVLAAIWLIIDPFILGYVNPTARTNDIWLGVIIGVLALIRVFTGAKAAWLSWINILAGLWLIIAPFVLGYYYVAARWNDVLLGIIVAVFAIWSSSASAITTSRKHAHA